MNIRKSVSYQVKHAGVYIRNQTSLPTKLPYPPKPAPNARTIRQKTSRLRLPHKLPKKLPISTIKYPNQLIQRITSEEDSKVY